MEYEELIDALCSWFGSTLEGAALDIYLEGLIGKNIPPEELEATVRHLIGELERKPSNFPTIKTVMESWRSLFPPDSDPTPAAVWELTKDERAVTGH